MFAEFMKKVFLGLRLTLLRSWVVMMGASVSFMGSVFFVAATGVGRFDSFPGIQGLEWGTFFVGMLIWQLALLSLLYLVWKLGPKEREINGNLAQQFLHFLRMGRI